MNNLTPENMNDMTPEIKDEIDRATEDLRDALGEIDHKIGDTMAQLQPTRALRDHPAVPAILAAALGFATGRNTTALSVGSFLVGGLVGFAFCYATERHR